MVEQGLGNMMITDALLKLIYKLYLPPALILSTRLYKLETIYKTLDRYTGSSSTSLTTVYVLHKSNGLVFCSPSLKSDQISYLALFFRFMFLFNIFIHHCILFGFLKFIWLFFVTLCGNNDELFNYVNFASFYNSSPYL
jgi:hypothetical protein